MSVSLCLLAIQFLDLAALITNQSLYNLVPKSAVGMIWVQMHFSIQHWDDLIGAKTVFKPECINKMFSDARKAGLEVHWETPVIS